MSERMTPERYTEWTISDEAGELTWDEERPNSVAELWFALVAEREYAERECVWTKYDADNCGFENCWATTCGEDYAIVEEWHDVPPNFCNNCGGKVDVKSEEPTNDTN